MLQTNASDLAKELVSAVCNKVMSIGEVLNEIDKKVDEDLALAQILLTDVTSSIDDVDNILFQYVQARINERKYALSHEENVDFFSQKTKLSKAFNRNNRIIRINAMSKQLLESGLQVLRFEKWWVQNDSSKDQAIDESSNVESTDSVPEYREFLSKEEVKRRRKLGGAMSYPIFELGYEKTNNPIFLFYMGVAASKSGCTEDAISCFKKYLQVGSEMFVNANLYLVSLFNDFGDDQQARYRLAVVAHLPNIFDSAKYKPEDDKKKDKKPRLPKRIPSVNLILPKVVDCSIDWDDFKLIESLKPASYGNEPRERQISKVRCCLQSGSGVDSCSLKNK